MVSNINHSQILPHFSCCTTSLVAVVVVVVVRLLLLLYGWMISQHPTLLDYH